MYLQLYVLHSTKRTKHVLINYNLRFPRVIQSRGKLLHSHVEEKRWLQMCVVLCVCYCLHKLGQNTHRIQTSCQTNSLRRTSHLGLRQPQKAQEDPGIGCSCSSGHAEATQEAKKMPCCACREESSQELTFGPEFPKESFFLSQMLNTKQRKEFPPEDRFHGNEDSI